VVLVKGVCTRMHPTTHLTVYGLDAEGSDEWRAVLLLHQLRVLAALHCAAERLVGQHLPARVREGGSEGWREESRV
jgi:hypothetical protein